MLSIRSTSLSDMSLCCFFFSFTHVREDEKKGQSNSITLQAKKRSDEYKFPKVLPLEPAEVV